MDLDLEEDHIYQQGVSRNGAKREHPFHLAHGMDLAALVLELALEKQTQKPAKTIQSWTDRLMWSQL